MRKLYFILIILILLNSCSKNYEDILPTCQFVSAAPYGQDSLFITGQVLYGGVSAIQYVGFAYSEQPNVNLLNNQILGGGTQGTFSTIISAFPDTTYYFECFVANEYGYGVSPVFKYTMPYPKPDSAPCSLTNNYLTDNGNRWAMSYINAETAYTSFGSYDVNATDASGYEQINIYFNKIPTNGIYTTDGSEQDFIENPNRKFSVLVTIGSYPGFAINSGGQVYIAQNSNDSATVSFCSLTYTVGSYTVPLSGKITF